MVELYTIPVYNIKVDNFHTINYVTQVHIYYYMKNILINMQKIGKFFTL